ncbi:TPA: hypothetical protein ACH3X1_002975 [Trebouxia sp. C0004]
MAHDSRRRRLRLHKARSVARAQPQVAAEALRKLNTFTPQESRVCLLSYARTPAKAQANFQSVTFDTANEASTSLNTLMAGSEDSAACAELRRAAA